MPPPEKRIIILKHGHTKIGEDALCRLTEKGREQMALVAEKIQSLIRNGKNGKIIILHPLALWIKECAAELAEKLKGEAQSHPCLSFITGHESEQALELTKYKAQIFIFVLDSRAARIFYDYLCKMYRQPNYALRFEKDSQGVIMPHKNCKIQLPLNP